MYYVHTKHKTMEGEPHLGYQYESDLIEADGEAEAEWMQQVVDDQFPSQHFTVIDWKSEDEINLDITDYLGQRVYRDFEECIFNLEEEEFSAVKADSFLKACLQHERKRGKRCK